MLDRSDEIREFEVSVKKQEEELNALRKDLTESNHLSELDKVKDILSQTILCEDVCYLIVNDLRKKLDDELKLKISNLECELRCDSGYLEHLYQGQEEIVYDEEGRVIQHPDFDAFWELEYDEYGVLRTDEEQDRLMGIPVLDD